MKTRVYETREYRCWEAIKQRCGNLKTKNFHRYGGRGIRVCARWLESFDNFLADMGERPSPEHSIDRIDNDGDYCPENCRWATRGEQQNNKSNNRILTHNGVSLNTKQWSEKTSIPYLVLHRRVMDGWSVEDVLTTPKLPKEKTIAFNGVSKSKKDWAKHIGISANTLKWRLSNNWSIEKALTTNEKGK